MSIKNGSAAKRKEAFLSHLSLPLYYHAIFWVVYFALNILRWGSYFDDYWYSFKSNLVEFPIHLCLVYFNLYYLLPKYIPNRYIKYIAALVVATLLMSLLRIILTYEFVTTIVWRESVIEEKFIFGFNYILAVFIGELYVLGLTTAIKLIIDWVQAKNKTIELERINHDTELSFLRSQVQPHFFFNTLNNLYSLTLDKSDKAPETVLKLSDLMSYVIYKGKNKRVGLPEEVEHIQNYIDLERLRFGDSLVAKLNITGDIQQKYIPPLILMPFIENSFKHGVHYKNGKMPIYIDLIIIKNTLRLTVKNSKYEYVKQPEGASPGYVGIGIKNTRRRLELLYNKNFILNITDSGELFKVYLEFPLDSMPSPTTDGANDHSLKTNKIYHYET